MDRHCDRFQSVPLAAPQVLPSANAIDEVFSLHVATAGFSDEPVLDDRDGGERRLRNECLTLRYIEVLDAILASLD